jgi:predicted GNAT family N-acyltransferase
VIGRSPDPDWAAEVAVRAPRDAAELDAALALRHQVFVVEQGVPVPEEIDEHDATALHVVAVRDGEVIGTCRVVVDRGVGKLGRMAVRQDARGAGIGSRLLDAAEDAAGVRRMILAAQVAAEPFYAAHGYGAVGAHFEEAGIEHVRMEKTLA